MNLKQPAVLFLTRISSRHRPAPLQAGFTLIELMAVVLLLGILASIALPTYQGYQNNAARLSLLQSIASMHVFQEDYRMRHGRYGGGIYDRTNPQAPVTTLTQAIGWQPLGEASGDAVYVVTADTDDYTVTATRKGVRVSKTFP